MKNDSNGLQSSGLLAKGTHRLIGAIASHDRTGSLIQSTASRCGQVLHGRCINMENENETAHDTCHNIRRLSTEAAPPGIDPFGDIAYYAPWGNLAMYYNDFGYSNGLAILGKIDGGINALNVPGSIEVTIEL